MSMDEESFYATYFIGRYDQLKQTLDEAIAGAPGYAEKWKSNTESYRVAALVNTLHMGFTQSDHLYLLAIAINYLGMAAIGRAEADGSRQ